MIIGLKDGEILEGTQKYVVESPLARGGLGVVYKVQRISDGVSFVAKQLSDHRFSIDDKVLARFRREVEIQRSLSCPNVIAIVDVANHGGVTIPILEWAELGSLNEFLQTAHCRTLPIPIVLAFMRQIATGVARLHSAGIVHRDLTPKNILRRSDGTLAVSDFGIARRYHDLAVTTETDRLGSLIYISARQREEPHEASFVDDVFSLGQVYFHLVTGTSPHGTIHRADKHRVGYPDALASLLDRMRSFDPAKRPESATEVVAALDLVAHQLRDQTRPVKRSPELEALVVKQLAYLAEHQELPTSKTLELLIKNLGPILLDVRRPSSRPMWFETGSLGLEYYETEGGGFRWTGTILKNKLGAQMFISANGYLPIGVPQIEVESLFEDITRMGSRGSKGCTGTDRI